MRIAIVHDWMVSPGGGEKTVYAMHKIWPDAPIFTAAYAPEKFPEFAQADVRPTWLNRISLVKKKHQLFSLPRAWAFKMLDLSAYDVVISSSSAESKYIKTGPDTVHICYCHTPTRYYWSDYEWYLSHFPIARLQWLVRLVMPFIIGALRRMDFNAAQKVDHFIANSTNVRERIKRFYKRDSVVIYPPIETNRFTQPHKTQDYYLIVGRQVAYKRLDLAVDAFNELGFKLKVVGAGEEIARQQPRSKPNIEYVGRPSDQVVADLYAGAKAFIFPPEEDFGMVPVEALSSGTPVIAYAKGGALEYVVEGETGTFFTEQTPEALAAAVHRFESMTFSEKTLRAKAASFDEAVFAKKLQEFVSSHQQKYEK